MYAFAGWAHDVFNCATQLDLTGLCSNLEGMCALFDRSLLKREAVGMVAEGDELYQGGGAGFADSCKGEMR